MKRMKTLTCIVLALSLLGWAWAWRARRRKAPARSSFQQKTEIYDQLVELPRPIRKRRALSPEVWAHRRRRLLSEPQDRHGQ